MEKHQLNVVTRSEKLGLASHKNCSECSRTRIAWGMLLANKHMGTTIVFYRLREFLFAAATATATMCVHYNSNTGR
jgi:hypothetical protein